MSGSLEPPRPRAQNVTRVPSGEKAERAHRRIHELRRTAPRQVHELARADLCHPHILLPIVIRQESREPSIARERGGLLDPIEVGEPREAGVGERVEEGALAPLICLTARVTRRATTTPTIPSSHTRRFWRKGERASSRKASRWPEAGARARKNPRESFGEGTDTGGPASGPSTGELASYALELR